MVMKKEKENVQETQCPNCWGYQEYEGEVINTVIKPLATKGWILRYFDNFLNAG